MGENEKKCPWHPCTEKFYGSTEAESTTNMRDHVEIVHMAASRKNWNTTLNTQNEEVADRNVSRVLNLLREGFTRREAVAILGCGAVLPKMNNRQEGVVGKEIDFPKWAKDQNYESWKVEFEIYKEMMLGKHGETEKKEDKREGAEVKKKMKICLS